MVKLTAPALGQQASGSLAGAITFSNSRGRAYLKKNTKPKQPRSKPQIAMRAYMSFLSKQWSVFTQPARDTWLPKAEAANISPFNAYQRDNLQRLRNFEGPSAATPPTLLGTWILFTNFIAQDGVHSINLGWNVNAVNQGWGSILYIVDTPGGAYTWQDAVHVIPLWTTGWHYWLLTGLTPGTYHFRYSAFTYTGVLRTTYTGARTAIAT